MKFLYIAVAVIAVATFAGWLMRSWLRGQNDSAAAHYKLLHLLLWSGGVGMLVAVGVCVAFPSLRPSPPVAVLLGAAVLFMAIRVRSLLRKTGQKNPALTPK